MSKRPNDYAYYERLCLSLEELPERAHEVTAAANLVLSGRARYQAVADVVSLPWWLIGVIHLMESGCSWRSNLLNGEPIDRETHLVPQGRGPWQSWDKMAIEVMAEECVRWPSGVLRLAPALMGLEAYNGWGYRLRGVNSPYLWAGSNHGVGVGKFVRDGHYDAAAVSDQIGAAVVLCRLGIQFDGKEKDS